MTTLGSRLKRGAGRMALGVIAAMAAAALMAPLAGATPESDASDAINQAWEAAGGEGSPVGTPDGDVYAAGDGFGRNFSGGKIFFNSATGAHLLYGPVLDKYQELGGPADSDLGFPTMDVVTGLVGPDSRVSTFSAGDKPVIFWTPSTGAWVVRGAINAGWDKLGGSAGALGVPVADETYDGDVVSQKFSGGELSWNGSTKAYTSVPADLAADLTGVEVPTDATTAINQAWRASGGLSGPLGARQGAQSAVGDNGAVQSFANGKIFYSPATGAHAVTGAILSKYEAAGGPTGDLGFPSGAEVDGGAPNSRVSAFSAPDKPVIFWTPDSGAIVVRGAINAAWAKLGGATGQLGVPSGEQKVDGDTVTQKFSGGELFWNEATKTFTSEPPSLASSLAGVEVPNAGTPQAGPASDGKSDNAFKWRWWWLLVIIPILLLIGVLALGILWLQRRRGAEGDFEPGTGEAGFDEDDRWSSSRSDAEESADYGDYPDGSGVQVERLSGSTWSAAEAPTKTMPGPEDVFDGDQDSIDTTPTRIPADEPYSGQPEGDHEGIIEAEAVDLVESDLVEPDRVESDLVESDLVESDIWAGERPFSGHPAGTLGDEFTEAPEQDDRVDSGRHAAVHIDDSPSMWRLDMDELGAPRRRRSVEDHDEPAEPEFAAPEPAIVEPAAEAQAPALDSDQSSTRPAIHLPLADPYRAPEGYVIKANTHSGLYYTPDSMLYEHTLPEVWFASEELAQANGFVKAPE